MRSDVLAGYLSLRPFQPLRLHLSTGVFFEIRQPELVEVSRSTLTLGLSLEGDLQRFVVIALVHIVWIEMLLPTP
jgi:hypothetical protein